jgi:hypothetical protein
LSVISATTSLSSRFSLRWIDSSGSPYRHAPWGHRPLNVSISLGGVGDRKFLTTYTHRLFDLRKGWLALSIASSGDFLGPRKSKQSVHALRLETPRPSCTLSTTNHYQTAPTFCPHRLQISFTPVADVCHDYVRLTTRRCFDLLHHRNPLLDIKRRRCHFVGPRSLRLRWPRLARCRSAAASPRSSLSCSHRDPQSSFDCSA